jgi:hypothetical protein
MIWLNTFTTYIGPLILFYAYYFKYLIKLNQATYIHSHTFLVEVTLQLNPLPLAPPSKHGVSLELYAVAIPNALKTKHEIYTMTS